jgi:hypothetical protein
MWKAVFALGALAVVAPAPANAQAWADKMFGDKENLVHDFKSVARGAQLFHRFKITNIYAVPMEITNWRSSCTCGTVNFTKKTLQPREEGFIEVTMDTKKFTGPKTLIIYVTVGPQFTSTAELKLTAVSRADVVFNPGEVNFGAVPRGQTRTQDVDVEYAGVLDWKVSEVDTNGAPVDVTLKEWYRNPGKPGQPGKVGYKINVALKADAPAGALKHELFLKTNDPASPLVPLLVEVTIQAPLSVTPSAVHFGEVKVGEAKSQRVLVRGGKAFRIVAIDGLTDGLTAEFPAEAGEARIVVIKWTAAKAGELNCPLVIKTDLAKDNSVSLTVTGKAEP